MTVINAHCYLKIHAHACCFLHLDFRGKGKIAPATFFPPQKNDSLSLSLKMQKCLFTWKIFLLGKNGWVSEKPSNPRAQVRLDE